MQQQQTEMTDAQAEMICDLDDVAEHVAWEFDPDEYRGVSTVGFAHIYGLNGNKSFVRRIKSLAGVSDHVTQTRRGEYEIEIGGLELRLAPSHDGGYRLSITDIGHYIDGPEYQRLDVRERLHSLVLHRLRSHGYFGTSRRDGADSVADSPPENHANLTDARVHSRMD